MSTRSLRIGTAATATLRPRGVVADMLLLTRREGTTTAWLRTDAVEGERAEASFEATRSGWHEAWFVIGEEVGTTTIVVAWRTAGLQRPAVRDGVRLAWLEAGPAGPRKERIRAARELARYFILGWTKRDDTDIGRHLHEERSDPYPELSRLALDSEQLLCRLAYEPESLDEDDWDVVAETGEHALRADGKGQGTQRTTPQRRDDDQAAGGKMTSATASSG